MSNSRSNKEQSRKIELTENQQNPYAARPEDFEVEKPLAPGGIVTVGHGQHGATEKEQKQLFEERKPTGKGAPLPTSVDDAKAPHSK